MKNYQNFTLQIFALSHFHVVILQDIFVIIIFNCTFNSFLVLFWKPTDFCLDFFLKKLNSVPVNSLLNLQFHVAFWFSTHTQILKQFQFFLRIRGRFLKYPMKKSPFTKFVFQLSSQVFLKFSQIISQHWCHPEIFYSYL